MENYSFYVDRECAILDEIFLRYNGNDYDDAMFQTQKLAYVSKQKKKLPHDTEIATYVETISYTTLVSPIWLTPYFGINAEGLLWKLFRLPAQYSYVKDAVLHRTVIAQQRSESSSTPQALKIPMKSY
ncbi:hypothetical protein COOONC_01381 [Cooperia oncophora]